MGHRCGRGSVKSNRELTGILRRKKLNNQDPNHLQTRLLLVLRIGSVMYFLELEKTHYMRCSPLLFTKTSQINYLYGATRLDNYLPKMNFSELTI